MYANVTVSSQYAFADGSAFLSMDWCATGSKVQQYTSLLLWLCANHGLKPQGLENLQPSGPELFVSSQLTKAFLVPHGGSKVRVVKKERLGCIFFQ